MSSHPQVHGIVADFGQPTEMVKAAMALRAQGYRNFECHTPFPIHGLDQAYRFAALNRSVAEKSCFESEIVGR